MSVWKQKASSSAGANGEGFERPPIGNHPAVLVALIDMGHQEQEYQGNVTTPHRAYFVWELVNEKMSGMKNTNHVIAIDLTVSLNKKAKLRQWIEARVGKQMPEEAEYDISQEVGKPCLLDVIASKSGYPVVNGMKAVPKGMTVPEPQRKPVIISLDDFRADPSCIPDWIPYHFGKPLADVISQCEELADGAARHANEASDGAGLNPDGTAKSGDPIPW